MGIGGLDSAIQDFVSSYLPCYLKISCFLIFIKNSNLVFRSSLLVVRLDPSLAHYLVVILAKLWIGFWIVEFAN